MLFAAGEMYLLSAVAIFLVPLALFAILAVTVLRHAMRAAREGLDVTIFELAGMRLRRVDIAKVLDALAVAAHHGVDVSQVDVQRAVARGADVASIIESMANAGGDSHPSFDDLVGQQLRESGAVRFDGPAGD
jgi:uncharacterized protein YqfA (UPF0365 family)